MADYYGVLSIYRPVAPEEIYPKVKAAAMKARIYAALGETDEALRLLEKCWEETPRILLQLNSDPELDVLRGEQRFKDLLERSGIPMGELAHLSE